MVAKCEFKFGALRREKSRGLAFYTRTSCLKGKLQKEYTLVRLKFLSFLFCFVLILNRILVRIAIAIVIVVVVIVVVLVITNAILVL